MNLFLLIAVYTIYEPILFTGSREPGLLKAYERLKATTNETR